MLRNFQKELENTLGKGEILQAISFSYSTCIFKTDKAETWKQVFLWQQQF